MTAINIPILFQNSDWLAVNKPPEISVHNAEDATNLLKVLQQQGLGSLYPVHRLDKETSGVQILARNASFAEKLAKAFQKRSVDKIYGGILRGQLSTTQGVWNQPLTDKSEGRKNPQGISSDRVPCETQFKILKANSYFTLCEFHLITGRQHQIRKHTALAGHPLVGDARYGDPRFNQKMVGIYKTSRMFLHCSRFTLQEQTIAAPLPEDFSRLIPD